MKIVAFDSETFRGKAILLTTPYSYCEPKSWEHCIDFISEHKHLAAYNMDYDFQALLCWLPRKIRERLANFGETDCGLFRIRYARKKFAKVWCEDKLLFTLYDMFQFHNTSLAKAVKKMGIKDNKQEIPKDWYKNMLARLQDPLTRQLVLDYAMQDAKILQRLIDRTSDKFKAAGLDFVRPMSNASFAERRFRKELIAYVPSKVEALARKAYFGGRIECLQLGYFPVAYSYDIRSAYPSIIAGLVKPNGKWVQDEQIRDDAIYAFIDCDIEVDKTSYLGPIPRRSRTGMIDYPVGKFRRVLSMAEFETIIDSHSKANIFPMCYKVKILKVHRTYQMIWPKYEYPFADVAKMYQERLINPEAEYAIKIILNSVYGKTGQTQKRLIPSNVFSVHTDILNKGVYRKLETLKRHTSFVYASEITARVRQRLITEIDPSTVISYSTDGVITTVPAKGLDESNALGAWKSETITDFTVLGSGIYSYVDAENKRVTKFRGFSSSFDLSALLRKARHRRTISIPLLRNTSLKQSIADPDNFNILRETTRILDINFDRKRVWSGLRYADEVTNRQYTSRPFIVYPDVKLDWLPFYVSRCEDHDESEYCKLCK